MLLPTNQWLFC